MKFSFRKTPWLLILVTLFLIGVNTIPNGGPCHPMCSWQCDDPRCNAECEPICEAPTCQVVSPPVPSHSVMRHGKSAEPDCEIVCPPDQCSADMCPQCETRCQPLVDACDGCVIQCEQPVCSWVCRMPTTCPKPTCVLQCELPSCGVGVPPDPTTEAPDVVSSSGATFFFVNGSLLLCILIFLF
jgi:hypothetical protein